MLVVQLKVEEIASKNIAILTYLKLMIDEIEKDGILRRP